MIEWFFSNWAQLMLLSACIGVSWLGGFHFGVDHTFKCLRKAMDDKYGVNK